MKIVFLLVMSVAHSQPSFAITLTENFSSATYFDSTNSTAVWNSALGRVHTPLAIDPDETNGTVEENSPVIDLGDGSDGVFDITTYANFSEGGSTAGNVITLNTDTRSYYNFTNFTLASGWTIRGKGSNPLWIRVQGNFVNSGTITCSGDNGESTSTLTSYQPKGGTGRCGGGSGGNGGYNSAAYVAINSPADTGGSGCTVPACIVSGGTGGQTQTTNSGGGGGGGGYFSGAGGGGGTGTGPGAGGTSLLDPSMTKIGTAAGGPGGGSGGGGGGYATTTGPSSGAGGGAGGGVIRLSVGGTFTNSGSILANGGNGGSFGNAADRAGAGGAGAGGTIWLLVGGNYSNPGTISAVAGTIGSGSGGGGNGGSGASGRTWVSFGGTFSGVSETPTANMLHNGFVRYSELAYVIQSKSYDSRNTKPTYTAFNLTGNFPATSTTTLSVAGSNDNFASDNTGWIPSTGSLTALAGKRYFKFKINIQYVAAPPVNTYPNATPLLITGVTATYDGNKMQEFTFSPACGTFGSPWEFLMVIVSCFAIAQLMKRKKTDRQNFLPTNS